MNFKYTNFNGFLCIENISKDTLDLDKTLDCGQCFRWNKLPDGTWLGVVNNKQFMIKHKIIDDKSCIITTATLAEWRNTLIDYFDLNTDYKINIPKSDKFAQEAYKYGKGIRILKQDPWECLISFIISQRNNIPKIKSTIDKFCKRFGDKISIKVNNKVYEDYTFPTLSKLANITENDLSGLGLGYRDAYIISAIHSNINLNKLKDTSISEDLALAELTKLYGVGPKVANCVALFGLHKLNTFPIDIWMQRIINQYYNGNIDIRNYQGLAGLIQQYMFYYIRFYKGN